MNMIDRNPQGRDTGEEGIVDAVKDRSAEELLLEILRELKLLRLSLVLGQTAAELEDLNELAAAID